jgi:outer membrane lipopolysaccharide assembly protein LptE/RlpB
MISACGFQLRGTGNHSLSGTQIVLAQKEDLNGDKNYRSFEKELRRSLKQAGAELTINTDSEMVKSNVLALNIVNLEFTSQGVSRDATGRANEHEVTLRLEYTLPIQQSNQEITINQTRDEDGLNLENSIFILSVTASYYQDYRNPAAGRVQKIDTKNALISDLTQRLIQQLEFKLKK